MQMRSWRTLQQVLNLRDDKVPGPRRGKIAMLLALAAATVSIFHSIAAIDADQ